MLGVGCFLQLTVSVNDTLVLEKKSKARKFQLTHFIALSDLFIYLLYNGNSIKNLIVLLMVPLLSYPRLFANGGWIFATFLLAEQPKF